MDKREVPFVEDDLNQVVGDQTLQSMVDQLMQEHVPKLVEQHRQQPPEVLTKVQPTMNQGTIVIKLKNPEEK